MKVRIYIEGGGDSAAQKAEFRQGLANFWGNAGLKGKRPRTVPCGGRKSAFENFCIALKSHPDDISLLLVDSELPFPSNISKWDFLMGRDKWEKPALADETKVYLMVQTMEAWLLADRTALQKYYGNSFHLNVLPPESRSVELLDKETMYKALELATKDTQKESYSKGNHSFQLIGLVDPQKVMSACPSAKELIEYLLGIL